MLLDIHTHHKEGIPGENILNVEPGLFEPAEGCYYSIGIHPWKVLETEPEDWKRLEDAAGHSSVLAPQIIFLHHRHRHQNPIRHYQPLSNPLLDIEVLHLSRSYSV